MKKIESFLKGCKDCYVLAMSILMLVTLVVLGLPFIVAQLVLALAKGVVNRLGEAVFVLIAVTFRMLGVPVKLASAKPGSANAFSIEFEGINVVEVK